MIFQVAGTLGLVKTASVTETSPGESFTYNLVASCSGLQEGCVNAVLTDTIPAEVDVTGLPQSTSAFTVAFDEATRLLTVTFTIPLPPPDPPGSVGLPAGSSLNIEIGVGIPPESQIEDGAVISNEATLSADESPPITAGVDVDVTVPRVVTPVATKAWLDGSAVAGSDEPSTITLGVRNASSSSAEVTELIVEDATPAVFDRFDVTGLGPVTMPAGADQVVVLACTVVLSACTDADYAASAPQPGPTLALPPGVAAADVTGLRFVFSNSVGTTLPFDPTGGTVDIGMVLRDTLRSTGDDYQPTVRDDVENCNVPSATDTVLGAVDGTEVCTTYAVQPAQATISVAKQFFSDGNGNFVADGRAVVGLDSPVSAITSVTNTSPFPVATITITEPSATSPSEYSKVDVTDVRLQFPAGATTAELVVDCGATAVLQTVTPPPLTQIITDVCPAGSFAESVTVTYSGLDAEGNATIAEGAVASLGVHGTLNDTATEDDANAGPGAGGDGVLDCSDATATSSIDGVGSAAGTACATLQLWVAFSDLDGIKSAQLPTILPGLPRLFDLSFTNNGSVVATNVVLADPIDPTVPGNPFTTVRLADLNLPATPPATAELYDPDVGDYVAFDPATPDPDLLERALGFRVTVPEVPPQFLPGNQTYALTFNVILRDGIETGATWQNCAGVGSDTQELSGFCSQVMTVGEHSSGAALQKSISPATSVRPQAGLPAQVVQLKYALQNTGTLFLRQLIAVDNDPAFFEMIDLTGTVRVNFPPGADQVRVDVCTSGVCGEGAWVLGAVTGSQTPALPGGVDLQTVTGVRVTFTAVPVPTPTFPEGDEFRITPGTNFPTTGLCTGASVCVDFRPRIDLRSSPGTPVPDQLVNTASGGFESREQSGAVAPIPPTQATHTLTSGTGQLQFTKAPDVTVAPGVGIEFFLVARNTGTGPIPELTIVEPFPEGLDFSPLDPAAPYEIVFQLPADAPEPPEVVFTPTVDESTGRVTALRWEFPGWQFLPGASVAVGIRAELAPGVTAGEVIENRAGASGDRDDLTCNPSLVPRPGQATGDPFGDGVYCTSAAQVTVLAGNAFRTQKWIAGNRDLGFLNSLTGEVVPLDDPACPRLDVGGQLFTRFPCVARVLPGQGFDFYLLLTNSGTNPATEVRLVDVFPHPGDTGVLLTGSARGTEWSEQPTLLSPVTLAGQGSLDVGYSTGPSGWCITELTLPPVDCDPGAWSAGSGSSTTGFRAVVSFADSGLLLPGESTALRFRMASPPNPAGASTDDVAWNSFAHTEFFQQGAATVQLPPTEPIKTGVALVFGGLSIAKTLDDPTGEAAELVFDVVFECTVTPEGAGPVVVADGTASLAGGEQAAVANVPAGAECRVWEPDAQGLISNAPDRSSAIVVEVPVDAAIGPITAELVNAVFIPAPPTTTTIAATTTTTVDPTPTTAVPPPAPTTGIAPTTTDPDGSGVGGRTGETTTSTTGPDPDGTLPATGSSVSTILVIAALLAGLGAAALLAVGRRRSPAG